MTRRVVILPSATRDLEDRADYLAARSMDVALRFAREVDGALQRIAAMPGIGSPQDFGRPDLANLRCFRVPKFKNYLVFYRPIDDGIEVLRVVHGARDLPTLFEGEGP